MASFLDEVIGNKERELVERKNKLPLAKISEYVLPAGRKFDKFLEPDGLKIIAELKPRSPSLGELEGKINRGERMEIYERYASAVSVLCDQRYFGGSVQLLEEVSSSISLPTLLKDFVIDPYQVFEGRKAGAEAVLLIVKILSDRKLESLIELVEQLHMEPVVEVQTEDELKRAEYFGAEYILINNRNLDTLKIDMYTVERLANKAKTRAKLIAASGIESAEQILELRPFASRFLIGSALMSSGNLEEKFKEFLSVETRYLERTGR
jgi:indole-3-glycerol phosphate synthase